MTRLSVFLLATVSFIPLCQAETSRVTVAPSEDIKIVTYSATHRQTVIGTVGDPTTITFPSSEAVYAIDQTVKIKSDGSGGDGSWLTPCKDPKEPCWVGNNITLWPNAPGKSYLTIITCTKPVDDGKCVQAQKPYPFLLIAKDGRTSANLIAKTSLDSSDPVLNAMPDPGPAIHNLIYRGGTTTAPPRSGDTAPRDGADTTASGRGADDDGTTHSPARRSRQRAAADRAAEDANERVRLENLYGLGGCHYTAKGVYPNPLTPLCPISNGQTVAMRFVGLQDVPTINVEIGPKACRTPVAEDERLARSHASGDYIVVEEHAAKFCLRTPNYVLEIIDTAFNPIGNPSSTGTPSSHVRRKILRAAKQ